MLEKRRDLMLKGISLADLLITVVRKPDGEGHAVLTVRTDQGDYVLDNLNDAVKPWEATGYRYPEAAGDQPYRALGDDPRRQHHAGRLGQVAVLFVIFSAECVLQQSSDRLHAVTLLLHAACASRSPACDRKSPRRDGCGATVSAPSRSASVRATFSTR